MDDTSFSKLEKNMVGSLGYETDQLYLSSSPFHATCMHIFTSWWSTEQCLLSAHTFGTPHTSLATWHYKKSRLDEGECTMQTVVVWHYQCEDMMDKATKLK